MQVTPFFHTPFLLHRRFYTQTFLAQNLSHRPFHTNAWKTHKSFRHTDACAHKSFYTQTLSTKTLMHTTFRAFCRQQLAYGRFHTITFDTQTLLHTALLHTDAFTRKSFNAQTLSRNLLYTQTRLHKTLLHTVAHKSLCTQSLLNTILLFTHEYLLHTRRRHKR